MSVITFPTTPLVTKIVWGQMRLDMAFESVFGSQSAEIAAPLWTALLNPAKFSRAEYAVWESIVLQLKGRKNQLALWHLDRPVPRGTMRGAMTFNGAHAQGATTLSILAAGQAGTTLLQGDHLGFGTGLTQQVVKVQADATVGVDDIIVVSVESFLRNAFADGASIAWNQPKALFRRVASNMTMDHARGGVDGLALDLIEDWRP